MNGSIFLFFNLSGLVSRITMTNISGGCQDVPCGPFPPLNASTLSYVMLDFP